MLGEGLRYRIGYTYAKAELDKDFISPQSGAVIAPKGSTLPGAPENVFSLSASKGWDLNSNMMFDLGFNAYAQGKSENFINPGSELSDRFGSFVLLGLNATLSTDTWSAMLYAKNIGDEDGVTGAFPISYWSYDTGVFENWYGNGNRQFIVQPRTIGLKLAYHFD